MDLPEAIKILRRKLAHVTRDYRPEDQAFDVLCNAARAAQAPDGYAVAFIRPTDVIVDRTRVIDWQMSGLPDSDITVLLSMPGSDEGVWPGYHDGYRWRLADGMPAPLVNAWAELPAAL